MNSFHRLGTIVLMTFVAFAPIVAQQPTATTQDQETVRVGTSVVQLDAVVTDKTGRRVKGLTAADFQVVDEGAPQNVDFFSAIDGTRVK